MAWGDLKGTLAGNAGSIPDPAVCAGSVGVSVGDLVFAVCGQQTSLTVVGCSDNLGNSYTAQNAGTDPGSPTVRTYYSRVTVAGTLTAVNFDTTASTNDWAGFAAVYTGPFLAPPIDVNIANKTTDAASPFTCPATGTLAISNELVVCWGAANQSTVWAATSPLLLDGNRNNSTNVKVALGSKVVSSTGTTSPEFTAAANPTTCILGTCSFKQEIVSTDGAVAAQSATAAGAGLSLSSSTDGAIAAQAATVAGTGLSTSTGTGAIAAQAAAATGTGTVEDAGITGTGALAAQSAGADGEGLSTTLSTDGVISAQAAAVDGEGLSASSGTGVLASQSAAVDGEGFSASGGIGTLSVQAAAAAGVGASLSTGTGTPASQAAAADGEGLSASLGTGAPIAQVAIVAGVGTGLSTGTGALVAQSSAVSGEGLSAWNGTGALVAQSSAVSGEGLSAWNGTGALVAQTANVEGAGLSISLGAGTLTAQPAGVGGVGLSVSIGTGALIAQAVVVTGAGEVVTVFPLEVDVRSGLEYGPTGHEFIGTRKLATAFFRRR